MVTRHRKKIRDDVGFSFVNTFILSVILIIVLYPLIYIVSASFSSASAVMGGRVWLWPVDFSLKGYEAVFRNRDIMTGYMNSLIYTAFGTAANLLATLSAAYPLSRKDLKARNVIMLFFSFTMFFSGGMIPAYLNISRLGLLNSRWALILPGAINVYNMIIARQFFASNIPTELLEASQLDGCTDFQFIGRVVIPLSGAIVAVLGLFSAVGHWNAYFNALLYLSKRNLYPLQVFLREILIQNTIDASMTSVSIEDQVAKQGLQELLKYSLIVVASVPVLSIYPFVQRYFVKGIMIGSIKG
jgi:putative aldouronate transport system permease protein